MMKLMSFLPLLLLFNACNGQNKTLLAKDSLSAPGIALGGQQKMIRMQGTLSGNVSKGLEDKAGNLWFITSGEGAYRYDGKFFTNFTHKDGLSGNYINAIIVDKSGNILLGTNKGVSRYDGKSMTDLTAYNDVSKKSISSLLEDKDGNLWLGTMDNGVYRYDGKTFTNFLSKDDHPFNLGVHHQAIVDILQDKTGNIWFCSWNRGGVWRYDGSAFTNFLPPADYYKPKDSMPQYMNFSTGYESERLAKSYIADDMIFSVSEDKAGNLWFATRRHGACRYDGKFFTSFREREGFVSRGVYAILEDRKGNIWLSTEDKGVWRFDGRSFINYTTKDGLNNNSVFWRTEAAISGSEQEILD